MIKLLQKPSKGNLLLSEPFLMDPNFKRAVVLLTEHNQEGTIGFILSKQSEIKLYDIMQDFPHFDIPVYYGGPVQKNTLHFIHKLGDMLDGSIKILDGVYWSGNFETLKILVESKQITMDDVRFFIGYSGWSHGQLDEEVKAKSWLITTAEKKFIFHNNPNRLWNSILKNMGKEYAIIANFPEDPSLN